MALGNAIKFIKQFVYDSEFRSCCNDCETKEELMQQMHFDAYEFENAINMQLVKCQTYDEAERVQEVKMWFTLF